MRPEDADRSYLLDMLHHALGAIASVQDITFEEYETDENLRLAIERRIEIIGEAARHLSDDFQASHPEVPWRKIIAQRHILAHEYGEIEAQLIWRVIQVYLPELVGQLEAMINGTNEGKP